MNSNLQATASFVSFWNRRRLDSEVNLRQPISFTWGPDFFCCADHTVSLGPGKAPGIDGAAMHLMCCMKHFMTHPGINN